MPPPGARSTAILLGCDLSQKQSRKRLNADAVGALMYQMDDLADATVTIWRNAAAGRMSANVA
jgi:hypothetical protein